MPVTFYIPGFLRDFTGGRSQVEFDASPKTVAEALQILWSVYPGVRDRVLTEQGEVRPHVNVFLDNENIRYSGGLATVMSNGSEIFIVPAVSGGEDLVVRTKKA